MLDWLFSDPLPVGTPAPDFSLPDDEGRTVRLRDFQGKNNVVLVWYPSDDTLVCTKQLCEFRDAWADVKARGAVVFGVNGQSSASHGRFRAKHKLPMPLLIDAGQQVGKLYHTQGLIPKRTVYLIGASGLIRYARRGKPDPAEVLAAAEPLS
jgi:peroxiredoxin Q/BCP